MILLFLACSSADENDAPPSPGPVAPPEVHSNTVSVSTADCSSVADAASGSPTILRIALHGSDVSIASNGEGSLLRGGRTLPLCANTPVTHGDILITGPATSVAVGNEDVWVEIAPGTRFAIGSNAADEGRVRWWGDVEKARVGGWLDQVPPPHGRGLAEEAIQPLHDLVLHERPSGHSNLLPDSHPVPGGLHNPQAPSVRRESP